MNNKYGTFFVVLISYIIISGYNLKAVEKSNNLLNTSSNPIVPFNQDIEIFIFH